jgi:hypothetical protein
VVKKGGDYGYINNTDKLVITLIYDGAYAYDCKYKILGVSKNKRRGFVNIKNEVVIPLKHDYIKKVNAAGTIIVQNEGKYGLYNYTGKLLARIEYDLLKNTDKGVYFEKDEKKGYLDENGKEPVINKNEVSSNSKYDQVYRAWTTGYKPVRLNNKQGVVDKSGKVIIPIIYDEIYKPQSNGIVIVKKNSRYGTFNTNAKQIIELKYSNIYSYNEKGLAQFKRGGITGFVDKNGKESNVKYPADKTYETFGGLTKVKVKGLYGFKNTSNKQVISPIYDYADDFKNKFNVIRVKKGAYIGVINKANKVIIPLEYDKVSVLSEDGIFKVEKNGKTAEIDYAGKTTKKLTSDPTFAKLTKYKSGEKWGFKDADGNVVITPQYTAVSEFNKLLNYDDKFYARAIKNGKCGLINKKNETILAFNYDKIWQFEKDIAIVKKDGRLGYYKAYSGFLTKIKFHDAYDFKKNEIAQVSMKKDGKVTYGYINKKGKEVIPPIYTKVRKCKNGNILATFSRYSNITVSGSTKPVQKYALYNSQGKQDVNLVLDELSYGENDGNKSYGKYWFKINGKSGEISQTSINQKKLSKIAKISGSDYGLDKFTLYDKNYIYIYNNTVESKRVHFNDSEFANFRAQTGTVYKDLKFGELLIIEAKKWTEVYVSKGSISQSKKVISKGYKNNCGKVIAIGNYLSDYTEKTETKTYTNN